MRDTLELVLILLACAVSVVVAFRSLRLPPLLGYLLVGVAFLMFSIGLEFSLAKLFQMRRAVFGLGFAQVSLTLVAVLAAAAIAELRWQPAFVIGGALAMS